jgi:hypothetical protein
VTREAGAGKCRRHGSKEGQLRSLGFSREAQIAPSVARGCTLRIRPDRQLHSGAVRCMLSVGPEVNMYTVNYPEIQNGNPD